MTTEQVKIIHSYNGHTMAIIAIPNVWWSVHCKIPLPKLGLQKGEPYYIKRENDDVYIEISADQKLFLKDIPQEQLNHIILIP